MQPIIVWFRQDLRLSDNPAFYYAAQQNQPIIPVYIFDTSTPKQWQLGGAQRWWLHHSLTALQQQLEKKSLQLILRQGDPGKILAELFNATKANAIYWNRCYEPFHIARDTQLKKELRKNNITVETFNSALLFEPWEIKNKQGSFFKVFTPFWRHCLQQAKPRQPLLTPKKITAYDKKIISDKLKSWQLLPTHPDWTEGLRKTWQPGEKAAQKQLNIFLENHLMEYSKGRDYPAINITSNLSPYLHFGEISPQQIWHATQNEVNLNGSLQSAAEKFLGEIGWREFCYYLLYHFPELPAQPFQEKFKNFEWQAPKEKRLILPAWQKGQTGYPIVDAGMRQLWQTGWMHNRVRMIVASFLTKDLLIPWQKGEAWFWDTLVDADLANNSAGWQWVAGCGADAAPYFRIFNPTLQGEKFDPEGAYVKRWVPELKNLPKKFIHKPWEAPEDILAQAKIQLGKNYPLPAVDHNLMRKIALKRYQKIK